MTTKTNNCGRVTRVIGSEETKTSKYRPNKVFDVLEIKGRRALLPDFVISNVQLQVNTTYEPLLCQNIKPPGAPRKSPVVDIRLVDSNRNYMEHSESKVVALECCIIAGGTVTEICPVELNMMPCTMVATAINSKRLSL
ncbi:hypothetical protein KIN20_007025 [Parelaphostrongylus tenuis]|uniref:Uncharacterized protein n=1 Tax=Parelaphostrongylus tenuis TaxID=148309 RepID=A0AAD5MKY6_PARTN|nr:hypothetical protein KIN20_007025 [Parelaphostrongylus tenuis]